VHPFYSYTVKL